MLFINQKGKIMSLDTYALTTRKRSDIVAINNHKVFSEADKIIIFKDTQKKLVETVANVVENSNNITSTEKLIETCKIFVQGIQESINHAGSYKIQFNSDKIDGDLLNKLSSDETYKDFKQLVERECMHRNVVFKDRKLSFDGKTNYTTGAEDMLEWINTSLMLAVGRQQVANIKKDVEIALEKIADKYTNKTKAEYLKNMYNDFFTPLTPTQNPAPWRKPKGVSTTTTDSTPTTNSITAKEKQLVNTKRLQNSTGIAVSTDSDGSVIRDITFTVQNGLGCLNAKAKEIAMACLINEACASIPDDIELPENVTAVKSQHSNLNSILQRLDGKSMNEIRSSLAEIINEYNGLKESLGDVFSDFDEKFKSFLAENQLNENNINNFSDNDEVKVRPVLKEIKACLAFFNQFINEHTNNLPNHFYAELKENTDYQQDMNKLVDGLIVNPYNKHLPALIKSGDRYFDRNGNAKIMLKLDKKLSDAGLISIENEIVPGKLHQLLGNHDGTRDYENDIKRRTSEFYQPDIEDNEANKNIIKEIKKYCSIAFCDVKNKIIFNHQNLQPQTNDCLQFAHAQVDISQLNKENIVLEITKRLNRNKEDIADALPKDTVRFGNVDGVDGSPHYMFVPEILQGDNSNSKQLKGITFVGGHFGSFNGFIPISYNEKYQTRMLDFNSGIHEGGTFYSHPGTAFMPGDKSLNFFIVP